LCVRTRANSQWPGSNLAQLSVQHNRLAAVRIPAPRKGRAPLRVNAAGNAGVVVTVPAAAAAVTATAAAAPAVTATK
jgi:hypothetical protein